jgi:hypothetical protein
VLGTVGEPSSSADDSWHDRRVDPRQANFDRDIAEFTDWVYETYGLRVQWTILGSVGFAPERAARQALVRRFAAMSKGREHKLFAFEIANEGWRNGFPGEEGRAELRALAGWLASETAVLVAPSSPLEIVCEGAGGLRELYEGAAADFATLHFDRTPENDSNIWGVVEAPWHFHFCEGTPALAANNEPIGPESSVAATDDPLVLSMLALVSYGSGVGAFVMHSGPGVRGGGAADIEAGRTFNLWEPRNADRIAQALQTLEWLLPSDFANWKRRDSAAGNSEQLVDVSDHRRLSKLYCFSRGQQAVCGVAGIRGPVEIVSRRSMRATAYHPVTGRTLLTKSVQAGERIQLAADPAAVILKLELGN